MYSKSVDDSKLNDSDWILVGVVGQTVFKKDKNDARYCIWYLTDLEDTDKTVKVFLFRDICESFWKEPVTTTVAILRPKLLPSLSDSVILAYIFRLIYERIFRSTRRMP